MGSFKAALVSLPWATFDGPSLPIGTLSAYAQQRGFDVKALHLHLNFAAIFGLENYDRFSFNPPLSDAICAAILFPENQSKLLKYCDKHIKYAKHYFLSINRCLRKIYEDINWADYNLVGFTTGFQQTFISLVMADWLKSDYPDVKIIMGGRFVKGELGVSILKLFPQIDYCVDGEGELAFVSLLSELKNTVSGFEANVPGLMFRDKGDIRINPRKQLKTLSGLPDPDFKNYYTVIEEHAALKDDAIPLYIPLEGSRGCSYKCAFCGSHAYFGNHRARPPSETAASIKRLTELYRITSVFFIDLIIKSETCKSLFPLMASQNKDYKFFCSLRTSMTKDELLMMKKAGLCEVQIGIESLDTMLLKKMRKGIRLIDNLQILKFCEELGIELAYNLILGFPTETQADIDRTVDALDYALSYAPPLHLSDFTLVESSLIYENPQKYGVKDIVDCPDLVSKLPHRIAQKLRLMTKGYKTRNGRRDYKGLKRSIRRWTEIYDRAKTNCQPILHYMDCNEFLRIEDFRKGESSITLDGWARELYLFCDSIKSFDEIKKRFPDVNERELKRTLNKLFKLKVMFKEGNDWLSLAIHASPENRRHMPFL